MQVKFHPPEMSFVEGFISRGDERVGLKWNEHFITGLCLMAGMINLTMKSIKKHLSIFLLTMKIIYQENQHAYWACVDTHLDASYLTLDNVKSQQEAD